MITLRKDKIWLRLENYENAGKLSLDEKGYTSVKLSGKNQTHAFGQIKQKLKYNYYILQKTSDNLDFPK